MPKKTEPKTKEKFLKIGTALIAVSLLLVGTLLIFGRNTKRTAYGDRGAQKTHTLQGQEQGKKAAKHAEKKDNKVAKQQKAKAAKQKKAKSAKQHKAKAAKQQKAKAKAKAAKQHKAKAKTKAKADKKAKKIIFNTDADYAERRNFCVAVNRRANTVTVYGKDEEGKFTVPVKALLCSCGIGNSEDSEETPLGEFRTSDRVRWLSMTDGSFAQYTIRINGHIWFHSVPYYEKDPSTLKSEEFPKLGQYASHGCVRLSAADAKWLYDNLDFGTLVLIYDDEVPGALGKPKAEKFDKKARASGWDPTDPAPENPLRLKEGE